VVLLGDLRELLPRGSVALHVFEAGVAVKFEGAVSVGAAVTAVAEVE